MKAAFADILEIDKLIEKGQIFYRQMEFLQKRVKAKLATRGAKIEVLINAWNKLYG